MPWYVINGLFLTQQVTGIQRYAYEMCRELDKFVKGKHLMILVPGSCYKKKSIFKNIEVRRYGRLEGIAWEQIELRHFLGKNHACCINFCNVTPLGVRPGITAVHDLMFQMFPEYFTSPRNRLSRIWHTFQAAYALKHEKWILCTSNFTKKILEETYPCAKGKIVVAATGWQHVLRYQENKNWKKDYPYLKPGEFFFSMATRARNKNGRWIFETARKNPGFTFAIAGRSYEAELEHKPSNLYLLGYISDEDACALMKNCKAFLFPSFYEGFGAPPLEAMALGADVAVSDAAALPEVFGKSVHYINPYAACENLEKLLEEKVLPSREVLERYSWEKSAKILYRILYKNYGREDKGTNQG